MSGKIRFRSAAMAFSAACLLVFTSAAPAQGASDAATLQPERKGIWGAIAYSVSDEKVGLFWGADKKEEAEGNALRHCRNRRGADCRIVTVFRNHRGSGSDDGSDFPYEHCGALAVGPAGAMGAASSARKAKAEDKALKSCGGDEKMCKIREWVCT